MRKLVLQQFLSLDGYAADKDHSTKFFEDERFGEESGEDMLKEMDRFDTIILGANTYKMFVEYWPEADNDKEIVADKLNSIPKIVFSSKLKEAPWGKWDPAKIERADAVEVIKKLKKEPGRDIVLWGSISLSKHLLKAGLVDEFQFRIVPVLLGEGTAQFTKQDQLALKLTRSQSYPSGLMFVSYQSE